jgi:hypothetical protein
MHRPYKGFGVALTIHKRPGLEKTVGEIRKGTGNGAVVKLTAKNQPGGPKHRVGILNFTALDR